MDLQFNDPSDFNSGGTWMIVGKADERGIAGLSMKLAEVEFDSNSGFLAPSDFEMQMSFDFADYSNIIIGDDMTNPTLDIGVIGGTWASTHVEDSRLTPLTGESDLGSFTGGVALAQGTFQSSVIPTWHNDGQEFSQGNLLDDTGYASQAENFHTTIRYAWRIPGDATGDGKVDNADAAILAENWCESVSGVLNGDFNDDGVVDAVDASILAANWSQEGTSESMSVPEPSILLQMTVGILALLGFGSRNRRSCQARV